MAYPGSTDWPGAVDAAETRVNGDIIDADDFNYQDDQGRTLQTWLGTTGDMLGDGIANQGPGGLLSPIASGALNIAHKFLARASYAAGKLLSVGDNYDAAPPAYTEKMSLDYQGILWLLGGLQLGATQQVTEILDQDDFASNSDSALATQQSIAAYITDVTVRGAPKIIVGNSVAGDSLAHCDYLDTGNGTQLEAALGAASSGDDVYVRPGTYDFTQALGPTGRLTIPSGVRLVGAGRDQVTIVTNVSGDCGAFLMGDNSGLEDVYITASEPTGAQVGTEAVVEATTGTVTCRRVTIDFDGSWSGAAMGDLHIWQGFGVGTISAGDLCLLEDCHVINVPKVSAPATDVDGIDIWATNSRVSNCYIDGGDRGIFMADSDASIIDGCIIVDCRSVGISLETSPGASISTCRVSDGGVAGFYAVLVVSTSQIGIVNNWMGGSAVGDYGVSFQSVTDSVINSNRGAGVFGGVAFIHLDASSDDNVVMGNAANGDSYTDLGAGNEVVHNV